MPSTSRCCVSPSTRPPHRWFGQAVGTKIFLHLFSWFGQRRRACEAALGAPPPPRGRRHGRSPGLTPTSCRAANVPFRDRRRRRQLANHVRARGHRASPPSCKPCHRASPVILRAVAGSTRADDVASSVDSATARGMTGQRNGAARPSRQGTAARRCAIRVKPGGLCPMTAAGSVAASKARRCPDQTKRWSKYFCPNRLGEPAVRRACTWRDAAPGRRGRVGAHAKPPSAARQRCADELDRTPSESGRSGRIQGVRSESSQVHASRAAARAAGQREAHRASTKPALASTCQHQAVPTS
jgi:hypothetical protein